MQCNLGVAGDTKHDWEQPFLCHRNGTFMLGRALSADEIIKLCRDGAANFFGIKDNASYPVF